MSCLISALFQLLVNVCVKYLERVRVLRDSVLNMLRNGLVVVSCLWICLVRADFRDEVQRGLARVHALAPKPKIDENLNTRANLCIQGEGDSFNNCVKDVKKYFEFLQAAFKHNWANNEFAREVRQELTKGLAAAKRFSIEQKSEPMREFQVTPATEEEKAQAERQKQSARE